MQPSSHDHVVAGAHTLQQLVFGAAAAASPANSGKTLDWHWLHLKLLMVPVG